MRMINRIRMLIEALGPISRRGFLQGAGAVAASAALPAVRPEVQAMRDIHGMVDAYNHAGTAAEYIASAHGKGIVHPTLQHIVGALTPEQSAQNLTHLQHLAGYLQRFKEAFPGLAQHPALLHLTPHATDAAGTVEAFGNTFNSLDAPGQLRMAERAQGFLQNPGWGHNLQQEIYNNRDLMNRYMDVSRGYQRAISNIHHAEQWRQQDMQRAAERQERIARGEPDPDDHGFDDEYNYREVDYNPDTGRPRFGRVKDLTLPSGRVVKARQKRYIDDY